MLVDFTKPNIVIESKFGAIQNCYEIYSVHTYAGEFIAFIDDA